MRYDRKRGIPDPILDIGDIGGLARVPDNTQCVYDARRAAGSEADAGVSKRKPWRGYDSRNQQGGTEMDDAGVPNARISRMLPATCASAISVITTNWSPVKAPADEPTMT